MARIVFNPISFGPSGLAQIVPIKLGGTGANNVAGAVSNLQLVSKSELNNGATGVAGLDANAKVRVSQLPTGAGGVVLLDANGSIPASYVPSGLVSKIVTLNGPTTVAVGQTATYTITNYDQFTTYNVSVSGGSASVNAGTVTLIAPSTTGQITLTINSVSFTINVIASVVNTPAITAPVNGAEGVSLKPTFTKSAFSVTGQAQTQTSVRWELSTDPAFTTLVDYYEGASNYTSWMPSVMLNSLTTYYVRVKDQGSVSGYSAWSPVVSFTTVQQVNFVTALSNSAGVGHFYGLVKLNGYLYAAGAQGTQGQGGNDALVCKYDTNGNLIWQRSVGGGGGERLRGITTDGTYLYVAGEQTSQEQGRLEGFIAKYDTNGNLIWQRGLGGAYNDVYRGITCDGTYVYAVGSSILLLNNPPGESTLIAKYDLNGNLIWRQSLFDTNSTTGTNSQFTGVVSDGSYLYAIGFTSNSTSSLFDALIVKYDANGNLIWQRALKGDSSDWFTGVVVLGSNLYVTGLQMSQGQGDYDALLCKYDTNGNLIWHRGLGGSAYECFYALATDGAYLYTSGLQASQSQGGYDALVCKYDLNGNLIWQKSLGSSSGDGFFAVVADGAYVYLAGSWGFTSYATGAYFYPDSGDGGSPLLVALPASGAITTGALVGSGLTGLSWSQPTLTAYTPTLTAYTSTLSATSPALTAYTTTLTAYTPTLPVLYSNF